MSSTGMRKINIEIQGKVGKVNIEYEVPKSLDSNLLAMEVKYIMNPLHITFHG